MICRTCQTNVADDLVFCTECGSRLHETVTNIPGGISEQTLVIPTSQQNKIAEVPVKKSKAKWILLSVLLFVLPAVAIGMLLVFKFGFSNNGVKPVPSPTKTPVKRKSPTPEKTPANSNPTPQSNNTSSNINSESADSPDDQSGLILEDRVSIDIDEHIAYPFRLTSQSKIEGEVSILEGDSYEGYVFTQEAYDEYFPDSNYKMFSFGEAKSLRLGNSCQKQLRDRFMNTGKNGLVLKTKFSQTPQIN